MLQIRTGVELAGLKLPFRKGLLTAAQLGAEGVEIDARNELKPEDLSQTGVRHVRKMLDDFNLRVAAVAFRTRRGYAVRDELDRRIDATKQALKLAYDLGARVVVNHIGRIPPADSPDWPVFVGALTDLGRYGQKVGALLAAETQDDSLEDWKRLFDALPAGSLGIAYSPAPLVMNNHSPAQVARALGGEVLHVHVNDATRDVASRRGLETELGRGSVDWPEILGVLEEREYHGWFTVQARAGGNPVHEVADALSYLKSL